MLSNPESPTANRQEPASSAGPLVKSRDGKSVLDPACEESGPYQSIAELEGGHDRSDDFVIQGDHEKSRSIAATVGVSAAQDDLGGDEPDRSYVVHLAIQNLRTSYVGLRAGDPGAEERLLASITKDGQTTPIVVTVDPSGHHEVIDGFRRVRALTRGRLAIVAAVVWPGDPVDALVELRCVQGRSPCAALEEGWLLAALMDMHGLSMAQLAVRFGRSKTWVHSRLSLVRQLPTSIREKVLSGELSGYVAWKLAVPFARANEPLAERFCRCVIDNGLSARQAEVIYRYLTEVQEDHLKQLVLDRPDRILRAMGVDGKGRRSSVREKATDRLEAWGRHSQGMLSWIHQFMRQGASGDTVARLALAWRNHRPTVLKLVEALDEVSPLSTDTL